MDDTETGTVTYRVEDRKAYLTLNRPERLNAVEDAMPGEIRRATTSRSSPRATRTGGGARGRSGIPSRTTPR